MRSNLTGNSCGLFYFDLICWLDGSIQIGILNTVEWAIVMAGFKKEYLGYFLNDFGQLPY